MRETLVHEEFVEALIRFHEAQLGISQHSGHSGIPPVEPANSWGCAENMLVTTEQGATKADEGQPPEARIADDQGYIKPEGAA